jgi:HEAT repeat protein
MNIGKALMSTLALIALLLSACSPPATVQSTPTLTPTATPSLPPTLTITPTLMPTATPSLPPTPTITSAVCPGSPYSLYYTNYIVPSDISSKLRSLIQDLSSPDPVTRASAATWIKGYGQEAVHAIPFLVILSKDETSLQWQSGFPTSPGNEAIRAIAEIKGKCAVLALKSILDNGEQITRDHAAQFLGNTLDPDALTILYDLLHDADWAVRDNALSSLGTLISNQIYDQYTLESLIAIATNSNEDSGIRNSAADGIASFAKNQTTEKGQAIDVLLQLAKDPNYSIRTGVAYNLRCCNEPMVIETLIFLLQDQDSVVMSYAADSLANLTGEDFGQDYVKWNEWWKSQH